MPCPRLPALTVPPLAETEQPFGSTLTFPERPQRDSNTRRLDWESPLVDALG